MNRGKDGLIRSVNICTATVRTNHPITRLYPLEVTATEETVKSPSVKTLETPSENCPAALERPIQEAARRGQEWMKEWVTSLRGPRRMSRTVTLITLIL